MPVNCCVYGCSVNSKKCRGVSFHSFPKDKALQKSWLIKLRHGKKPSKWSRVCSRHFAECDFNTPLGEDGLFKNRYLKVTAIPSMNLPVSSHPLLTMKSDNVNSKLANRLAKRNAKKCITTSDKTNQESSNSVPQLPDESHVPIDIEDLHSKDGASISSDSIIPSSTGMSCSHNISRMHNQLFSVCLLNEKQLVHFTGFKKIQFECLWKFIVGRDEFEACRQSHINSKDQLLLTLMKLRTNMSYQHLGFSFFVNEHFVSTIFNRWINGIYDAFKEVNFWSMYKKVDDEYDIIIDCTEIPIQGSGCPDIAQATYSNYKGGHTFKALVGVSESGAALYCSDLFGGATSDRQMVLSSTFLDHVQRGFFVLADKGFLVADLLETRGATLNIPPFRESRNVQMTPLQVATTKVIANRRIVVEQVIGKAKNYAILTDTMPNHLWPIANKLFYCIFFFSNFKQKAI